jgi:hypothetical protein
MLWVSVCSLRYPERKTRAHFVMCSAPLHNFFLLSHKRHNFRKKYIYIEHKVGVQSSSTFAWSIFYSNKNWTWYNKKCAGLFEITVRVLTTCHTQYSWDNSIRIFLFNRTTFQFLLHTLQALYMCTVCDSTNINTTIQSVPNCLWHGSQSIAAVNAGLYVGGNGNFLIHRCDYILLSQVSCVWQVVKNQTIISNHLVYWASCKVPVILVRF